MFDKGQLPKISGLQLDIGQVATMSEAELSQYGQAIHTLIDEFPSLEKRIKDSLQENDCSSFSLYLINVRDMLTNLYAGEMAATAQKLARSPVAGPQKAEAEVTAFLTAVSRLSIDLQMLLYKQEPVSAAPPAPPADKEKIILAVDDAAFFLNMLKTYLQGTEYKIVCVTSGKAALRYLAEHQPDLLIFDIEMPDMNGYQLAEKVREKNINTPIIFLTGNSAKEYVIRAIEAGAADFIIKPIDKIQVLERIKKFV